MDIEALDSPIEKLPAEIFKSICIHLLKANHVRRPKGYRFEVNIMRASKKLHARAREVLYSQNHFVTIRCGHPALLALLTTFRVPIICKDKARIRGCNSFLELEVFFPETWNMFGVRHTAFRNPKATAILLVHHEMPALVDVLRLMYLVHYGNDSPCELTFDFATMPLTAFNFKVEEILLEPFRNLTLNAQTVSFIGRVNPSYEDDLVRVMTFPFRWSRIAAWQFYSAMSSIKRKADDCLRRVEFDTAVIKYNDCLKLTYVVGTHLMAFRSADDSDGLDVSFRLLMRACKINLLLLSLKGRFWEDGVRSCDRLSAMELVLEKTRELRQNASPQELGLLCEGRSRELLYRGVALAVLERTREAHECFRSALALDRENLLIRRFTLLTKSSLTAPARSAVSRHITPDNLSNDPLLHVSHVTPCNSIENERHLLWRLGYGGDTLNHIATGRVADKDTMDVFAYNIHHALYSALPGFRLNKWIGGRDPHAIWHQFIMILFEEDGSPAGFAIMSQDQQVDSADRYAV